MPISEGGGSIGAMWRNTKPSRSSWVSFFFPLSMYTILLPFQTNLDFPFFSSTLLLFFSSLMVMKQEGAADVGKRRVSAVPALEVRRRHSDHLLLRRLHQNILYLKLRSLLPVSNGCEPSEVLSSSDELPQGVLSNDESTGERRGKRTLETNGSNRLCKDVDDDGDCFIENSKGENEEEEEARHEDFVPSIKVRKMDGALLISTVIQKEVALSSNLFRLLENEKLSIVFEHQYRTKTKVCHTIQLRVPTEMDVEAFRAKLEAWGAGKEIL